MQMNGNSVIVTVMYRLKEFIGTGIRLRKMSCIGRLKEFLGTGIRLRKMDECTLNAVNKQQTYTEDIIYFCRNTSVMYNANL